jgi:hypothetical protein
MCPVNYHKPRKESTAEPIDYLNWPVGFKRHFFDSGAFSLIAKAKKYARKTGKPETAYYDTQRFYRFMDGYAEFVKKYHYFFDHYSNMDAIPHAELSYRNQKYLEREHGLHPVPVFHYGNDLRWLKRYIEDGYDYIGIGAMARAKPLPRRAWLDRVFDFVCDTKDRCPRVRLHGFGVTGYRMMVRYPWYSLDSAAWTKLGGMGGIIMVPHRRDGKWTFDEPPYVLRVSEDSPQRGQLGKHFQTMSKAERKVIRDWLEHIDVPFGRMDGDVIAEYGVSTRHSERKRANLHFFEALRRSLPDYPWAFRGGKGKGFGIL